MTIRQIILLSVASATLTMTDISLKAAPLTPSQALGRAMESQPMRRMSGLAADPSRQFSLRTTFRTKSGQNAFYLFDSCHCGFIAVAADDRLPAVLGYSDAPVDRNAEFPDNFRNWLEGYSRQIDYLLTDNGNATAALPSGSVRKWRDPVEPLLTCNWDQAEPYNDLCPLFGDTGFRSVTGCVATAMAQVMYYHRWPERGRGEQDYIDSGYQTTLRFDELEFDWDNMLDNYGEEATEEQRKAVAELMLACGVSVQMLYTPSISGSYSKMVSGALTTYFDYHVNTSNVERANYSDTAWENMIYGELAAGRPVIYSGTGDQGGHEFVCDGYDTDGYYHFNWGWSGNYNGYFLLSVLTPEGIGIGGGSGNFSYDQDAIIGITPPDNEDRPRVTPMISRGAFGFRRGYTVENGVLDVDFTFPDNMVNASQYDINGYLGVILMQDTQTIAGFDGEEGVFGPMTQLGQVSGCDSFHATIDLSEVAPGEYRVYPAFRDFRFTPSFQERIPVANRCQQYVVLTIGDDRSVTLTDGLDNVLPELEITNLYNDDLRDGVINSDYFRFEFINGPAQFDGRIGLHAVMTERYEDEDQTLDGKDHLVAVVSQKLSATSTGMGSCPADLTTLVPAKYDFFLCDEWGNRISPLYPAWIKKDGSAIEGIAVDKGDETRMFDLTGREITDPDGYRGVIIITGPEGARKILATGRN